MSFTVLPGKPTARITQKMLGVYVGDTMQLKCKIEANPTPNVYWTHIDFNKLYNGELFTCILYLALYFLTAIGLYIPK